MLIGYFALRLVYINFRKQNIFFHCYLVFGRRCCCCRCVSFLYFCSSFYSRRWLFSMEKKIVLHLNVSFVLDYLHEYVCVCVCFLFCNLLRLIAPLLRYSLILIHQLGCAMNVWIFMAEKWNQNKSNTRRERKAFQTHIHINWANKLFRNDQIRARMSQMEGKPNSTKWFVFTHLHVPHTNRNCCLKCF